MTVYQRKKKEKERVYTIMLKGVYWFLIRFGSVRSGPVWSCFFFPFLFFLVFFLVFFSCFFFALDCFRVSKLWYLDKYLDTFLSMYLPLTIILLTYLPTYLPTFSCFGVRTYVLYLSIQEREKKKRKKERKRKKTPI